MNKATITMFVLSAIVLSVLFNASLIHATTKPQTTIELKVSSLDGYPVPKAYADIAYTVGNKSVGPINFPATDEKGQTNITFPLNQTLSAKINVTFLNTLVLRNYIIGLAPNKTLAFNLTVNVVNFTYVLVNPYGGLLNSSTISFNGLTGSNTSGVAVNENSPKGSILIPTGKYTVSAYRGPLFYSANITVNLQNRLLNITAPLLALKYSVVGVNGEPIQAQAVDLLYSGSLLNSSYASPGSFTGLLPGNYQLVAYAEGLTGSTTIALGHNMTVDIVLPAGYYVDYKLSDEFGAPLAGYNVTLVGELKSYSDVTNSSGIAAFTSLPQGEYIVEVYYHGQLVFASTNNIDSSGTQQLVLPTTSKSGALSPYVVVRLAFGLILIVLAALILLTTRTRSK